MNNMYGEVKDQSYDTYKQRLNSISAGLGNETPEYNLRGAYEGKLVPSFNMQDGRYHLGSRNPKTGELLKTPQHPTWDLLVEGEREAGYEIYQKGNKYFSKPINK